MTNQILRLLLDFINRFLQELSYRLGYLISELSEKFDLAERFVTGMKDHDNNVLRAQVCELQ